MNLQDFATLADAKAHTETRGTMIHRNTMNALLAEHGRYKRLKAIANDVDHPMCDAVGAFLDSTEYNLIQADPTGQKIITMFDALITNENNDPDLIAVRDAALALANRVYYPFADVTGYDFKLAKNQTINQVVKMPINGWLKITTTADCESHNPRIYADIQGVKKRVASFNGVSLTGEYIAEVPSKYGNLYVDDAYSVVS